MSTKVKTGVVRMHYCHFFKPHAPKGSNDEKFSGRFFVPKTDKETVQRFQDAIKEEIKEKWGKKAPANIWMPFKDGDDAGQLPNNVEEGTEPYEGHYYFNAKTDSAPGVVDENRQAVIDPSEVNWGDFGRVSVSVYAYDNVSKGIGIGLNNVQWLYKGEPLGSHTRAEDEFNDGFEVKETEDFLA